MDGFAGADNLRPIDVEGFEAPPAREPALIGDAPTLRWLPIRSLLVDDRYQRHMKRTGASNVRRIAAEFTWARFAPVIAAPAMPGFWSLIDGQHRTTAALLRGFDEVPAMVVDVDLAGQAGAFAGINGVVTAINPLSVHRAKVLAGDPAAAAVAAVCAKAGVTIAPYVKPTAQLAHNETTALASVQAAMRLHGDAVTALALRCIAHSGQKHHSLKGLPIRGVARMLADRPAWAKRGEAVVEACRRVNLLRIADLLQGVGHKPGADAIKAYADNLTKQLAVVLGPPVDVAA